MNFPMGPGDTGCCSGSVDKVEVGNVVETVIGMVV